MPKQSLPPSAARLAAVAAILGIVIEVVAGFAHPSHVQPNDSLNVFAEYALSREWIAVHLGQFVGAVMVGGSLLILAASMRNDARGASAAAIAAGLTGLIALVVFAVQMAVDGVALKAAIDTWASASDPAQRAAALGVADVVRSLEKGLDAIFGLSNGASLTALGIAIVLGRRYVLVLGAFGIIAGLAVAAAGWMTAFTGFSAEASAYAGPAQIALLVFLLGVAVSLARSSVNPEAERSPAVGAPRPAF